MGIPPLPSTTSSLINNPFPIDDPHQRPYPSSTAPLLSTTLSPFNDPHPSSITPLLSTTPSPINDLIHHQQPLFYRQTPLPSTISSFINHPLCYRRPRLLSTTPSPINLFWHQQPLLFINHFLTNMTTHTKNTHHLASVTVQVAENLTSASAFEMPDIVAERLKALPTSCEYSGLAYFPPSSFGEVLDCILLLGFSSDKALENWVSQLFGRHIDKPVDKLPGIVEAICRGKVGEGDDWASKLGEPNKAQLNAIQAPTKFFDPIINDWYEGVPQVPRFVLLCNQSFDKGCGRGSKRLCGNGLGTK